MNMLHLRQQLHQRIDTLPDDAVEAIADFTLFLIAKKQMPPLYEEWSGRQWQDFALAQFFREEDAVEYQLADAQEIYEQP